MRLHLNKTLRAALIAAFTTVGLSLTQASGAITSANAAGWASLEETGWVYSDSFVGSITSSAQSDIQFKDASGNLITFGSGNRSAYTFAVELDLSKLTTPTSNTSMVWGSNKVGFGVEASTRKVTAAIGSNPKWNTTNTALATTGTATIVVTTGDGGSRIFGYDSTGASLFSSSWGNLKEGNPSTHFYIAQAISPAVTKFAVWQTGNGTASEADMKDAYSAMKDFPLAPPTEYTWAATSAPAAWDTTSTVWDTKDATGTKYVSSASSTATFGTGEDLVKDVAVSGDITAGTVNVNDSYTFTVAADNSLTVGTLSVAAEKTATVAGAGTISLGTLSGAGKLALGENVQVSPTAISGTNTFSLADGSVLELAFSGLPATLTAEGTGTIRLLKGADQNTNLTTITAPILKLAADSSHNSRFVYNNSSNLSGVQNLYFDGAQLWLNSGTSALNFAGTVTFGTENHYSESANLDSAMRVNSSAKFSGAVDVQKDAKITWQAGNQSVEFAGDVTGSGNLTLATYNNGAQNGSKFIIGGDASQFAGALNINHASISLEIKEGAKLSIGSGSDLKGAVTLDGELTVNGAAAISGNITGAGSITKNGDGTLVLSGAGNVLTHTIVVNAGYMTLSGGFEIGGIAPTGGKTIYEGGQSDKNGYETATGNVVVYSGEGVDTTGGSFTYHGESVTLNNGAYTLRGEKDTTTFYINEGTESYSWIDGNKTEDFSNIVVKQAGTLLVNKDINMSLVSADSRGTVQIDSGYAATAAAGRNVTLTGAGTYVLEQSCVQGNQIVLPGTLGEGWTGTVQIHDVTTSATTQNNFTPLAKDGSTIELKGFNGLTNKWVSDQTENFKLTNSDDRGYAWYFSGATSTEGYTATFSGTWSGNGTMQTAGNNLNYKFTGNISDWDGKFQVASGAPDLTFSGNAKEVNAVIDRNGKTLHLFVGDGSVFSTTFKADVNASDLTVNANASATLEADATIGSVTSNGHVEMAADTTVTLSNNLTPLSGTVEVYGTLNVSHDIDLSSNGVSTATLSLKGGSETTAAGMWMATGARLLLEDGAVLNIGGLEIKGAGEGSITTTAENEKYGTDKAAFSITNATVTSTGTNVTLGNTLSGVDVFVAEGSSLTLKTAADSVTVNAGGTINKGDGGSISNLTVEDGGTIGEGIDATEVGIAADATATFAQGITDDSGVKFIKDGGVEVKNTNSPIGGPIINYSIDETAASVTADELLVSGELANDIVVNNELHVASIVNNSDKALTLTHITSDVQSIEVTATNVTIQKASTATLADLTIGTGATVAVYTDEHATTEGTVTITESLTAGGGKLLANLTIIGSDNVEAPTQLNLGGTALTLGSTLTVDTETGLILLDADTIAALEGLALGHNLDLFKALEETKLDYGSEYNGTWFDAMFVRTDGVHGDYLVYANETSFGLTKVSNVPEPTTGTLSLLALMALAARRRRK
ncbi:MAG: hypothetical protein MJ058_07020 [Akkermansia sp.]|nr:hypothetical protein [Akkermansia sp.]